MNAALLALALLAADPGAERVERVTGVPITVGVFLPYLTQPGVKVGTYFALTEWTATARARRVRTHKTRSLFLGPQVAVYTRPGNHVSLLLNAELGLRSLRHRRGWYQAFSLGAGHLAGFHVVSIAVDLGDPNASTQRREARSSFVPSLNYTLGQELRAPVGWFARVSLGRAIAATVEASTIFMLELGLQFRVGRRR